MKVTRILTNKWDFNTNLPVEEVKNLVASGGIIRLPRWEMESKYQFKKCLDDQILFLDLSKIEVFWYCEHNITLLDENKND